jgi:DNA-binding SARP family transcriptional activator
VEVTFGILGRTALQIDGRWDESWGRPRERAVLAVLLLHAGRPVRIDTLVELIWPENVPSLRDRAATVQTYATRIRRSLMRIKSEGVLIAQNGSYRVDVDRSSVDYFRSRSLVIDARSELRRGRPQQAIELASQAISLWRGQPLEDVQTDWARNWRLRVETDEWVPANTTFVEALIELGEFSEALIRVNEVSADYPHDLSLIKLRLTALHGLARYSDATTAYFTARRRLLDDSETQAADHLRQFYDNLINRHPALNRKPERTETIVVPRQLPNDLRDFIGRKSVVTVAVASQCRRLP